MFLLLLCYIVQKLFISHLKVDWLSLNKLTLHSTVINLFIFYGGRKVTFVIAVPNNASLHATSRLGELTTIDYIAFANVNFSFTFQGI